MLFILGIIFTILSFTVLEIDNIPERYHILTLLPMFITVGGAFGACAYSKKARDFFKGLIRAILEYL